MLSALQRPRNRVFDKLAQDARKLLPRLANQTVGNTCQGRREGFAQLPFQQAVDALFQFEQHFSRQFVSGRSGLGRPLQKLNVRPRGVDVEFHHFGECGHTVRGDVTRLRQVPWLSHAARPGLRLIPACVSGAGPLRCRPANARGRR